MQMYLEAAAPNDHLAVDTNANNATDSFLNWDETRQKRY